MTSSERHAQVKEIFLELCELAPEDRSNRLEEVCAGDHDLRSDVEALLAFDGGPPQSESGTTTPQTIGPYRLLQKIGEGGMGEVWEAEQQQPIRRRVALRLFKRATTVYEQGLGPDHWAVASSLGFSGSVLWRTGHYDDARANFERSLEILRSIGMEENAVVVPTIIPYAVMLMDLGEYGEAQPLLERGLALREAQFGPDHTAVGGLLADLARCCQETLRYDQARPLFERSLDIFERALGPNHPNLMLPLRSLAILDRQEGNNDLAAERLERALAIGERALGPEHPDLVWVLGPYARVLHSQDDVDGSRAHIERALRIAENTLGPIHVVVARSFEMLGFHHYQSQDYGEALRWYRRGFEMREQIFGARHPALGWNLYDQACILALARDTEAAFAALHRALGCGWANDRISEDDDLDSLRGLPEFQAILEEVRLRL